MAVLSRKTKGVMSRPRGTANRAASAAFSKPVPRSEADYVRRVRSRFGVPQRIFARLLSYSERAVADFENGRRLGDQARRRLAEIDRLQIALRRVVAAAAIPNWLQSPNRAFDGLKPVELIERGEIDRIWRMIFDLESGMPI